MRSRFDTIKTMMRFHAIAVISAVLLIAAVACGSEEPTTPTPSGTTATATPTTGTPATPTAPQPAQPTATAVPSGGQLPQPQGAAGTVTIAVIDIAPGVGLGRAQAPVEAMNAWGVGEAPFTATRENPITPKLATAFTLEPDLSGGTLSIREGVQFHGGFGEMTAEDVAWSMNDANAAVTPESIHGQAGDFAALFGNNPWVALDNRTIEFKFETFDPRWNGNFLNESAQALSIFSTAARDQLGEDGLRNRIISTGPFQVVEWVQDTQAIIEKVPYTHWLQNPEVEKITFIEVTEEGTRVAMLETGEADAASISLKTSPSLVEAGFATQGSGLGIQQGVFFSGNMWETVYAGGDKKGQPLDLSGHYVHDLPWIGNPRPGQHQADFAMDDLEQARLVRQALARSVDRDLINEVLLNGQGWPNYVEYFDITNPRWQAKWEYPFDPDEAESLLDQAGFPRAGGSGSRFEMPFYIGPELGGGQGIAGEMGDAIAGFWQDIGIDVPVLKYAYASFRPTVVGRQNTTPWLT
ncbi:MAG: ABC transporter substrate-binding protein, partial [Chloroflexi bacterium]|nr:ABC transporter substrate-binding protein [Chloroflexota bacterium]